jgi:5-methylcytosine-specific restriction endonuclease McrA
VSKLARVRDKLAIRDGWSCCWCGRDLRRDDTGEHRPTIEHLIPKSKGGSDRTFNLRLACQACNRARTDEIGPPPTIAVKKPIVTSVVRNPLRDACVVCGRASPDNIRCAQCAGLHR